MCLFDTSLIYMKFRPTLFTTPTVDIWLIFTNISATTLPGIFYPTNQRLSVAISITMSLGGTAAVSMVRAGVPCHRIPKSLKIYIYIFGSFGVDH